ncbi:SPFH domain-containing protein [Bifidobacterium vansinderenii]|uniref:Antifreeze protein type I n=1 Tax=Bifidobacterium vansinderenii TaxID=1984871 RepID=A0A229VWR2_9BIFI|nr:SPFH domain-containing protein [Bifidobacterium vansinderenii]OXN00043.1 antifreeze protein type I [Bifidobacterium vansinderenii]
MAIANVIQFEGDPDALVWKSPIEDFNTASQLIVDPTHEAIVIIEGHPEVYGEGRHTIETQNYFGLNAIQRMATGGETPFPCQVYFVNKVHAMDMKWGTREKIVVPDVTYGIMLNLGIRGSLSFVVTDSRKFVEKFTGYRREFRPEEVTEKFRGIISTEVKTSVAQMMIGANIDYVHLAMYLKEIGQILMQPLSQYFEDYGIKLVFFNMETIRSDEDDVAEIKAALSEASAMRIKAKGAADSRAIQGYDWASEKKADILKALATNQTNTVIGGGTGDILNGFVGLVNNGMGVGVAMNGGNPAAPANPAAPGVPTLGVPASAAAGSPLANMFGAQPGMPTQQQPVPTTPAAGHVCPNPNCGQPVQDGWKVCPACGTSLSKPKCPNCGQGVQDGWKVCPACGTPLNKPATCPNCNQPVQDGWKVCPACGTALNQPKPTCPNCSQEVQPGWAACPNCGTKL